MEKLVLFDIDGTLIWGRHFHADAFGDAFRQVHDLEAKIDFMEVQGMTDKQIILETLRKKDLSEYEIHGGMRQVFTEMVRSFRNMLAHTDIYALPGVKPLLDECKKRNYLIGHVTGNVKQIADAKMRLIGLDNYFTLGGYGNMHESRTMLVKMALEQASRRGFDRTYDNVFLFGDAPQDMRAGREAEVKTIGVCTGKFERKDLEPEHPYEILDDLSDTQYVLSLLK